MSQVEITFEVSRIILDRIAALPRQAFAVPEAGALPLYVDIWGAIGIRPDGTLVEWSRDGAGRDVRPLEDRLWVMIALAAAARQYPELQELLPNRGCGAVDCECRRIPRSISGLICCDRCGRTGWLSAGDARSFVRLPRQRRAVSFIGLVSVALAFMNFYGAFVILSGPSQGFIGNGVALIVVGILSLVFAFRRPARRRAGRRRAARGPIFTTDDPEVAALPPTSMTKISERIRQAREQQVRVED
jgi:hypothetical protein